MSEALNLQLEIDRLMGNLAGVLAARTVFNEDNEIIEIHILSDLSKSPKQLVRDIQSAVMASYGLDIDYKMISIAQVSNNLVVPAEAARPKESRLTIRKIMISMDGNQQETCVMLGQGDKVFEGSCRCALLGKNRLNSAAKACAAALQHYLGGQYAISLLDLQRSTLAGADCFVIAVSLNGPTNDGTYYGVAPIKHDETEIQTVVMAVLSALNRPLGKIHST
jgi:hypothetical protein